MMVYLAIPGFFNSGNCQNIMSLKSQMFLKLMLMTVAGGGVVSSYRNTDFPFFLFINI